MAQNNAETLIAVLAGGVLIYLILKKKPAAGAQVAGTPVVGVPTNPFASLSGILSGIQAPNQYGVVPVSNVDQEAEADLQEIFNGPGNITGNTGLGLTNPFRTDSSTPAVFTSDNGGVGGGLGITGSD